MKTPGLVAGGIAATMSFAAAPMALAQERSLDEIKTEVMRRAGRINPFEGIRRDDAEQVVNALTSLDRDHWAAAWCKVGLAYEGEGGRARQSRRIRTGARGTLHACVRVLPYRPLSRRQHAGQEGGLWALAAPVPQSGAALRAAACDCRDPVRGQDARRLSANPRWGRQAAGGDALGRGRRLEGESPARLELLPSCRDRHPDGGHAGHGREPCALRRSRGRAQLFRLDRSSHPARRH